MSSIRARLRSLSSMLLAVVLLLILVRGVGAAPGGTLPTPSEEIEVFGEKLPNVWYLVGAIAGILFTIAVVVAILIKVAQLTWVLYHIFKVVVAFLVLAGFIAVWRIPLLARENNVEQLDLTLAIIDSHQGDRLYLLDGYEKGLQAVRLPYKPSQGKTIQLQYRGPHQFEQEVTQGSPQPYVLKSTTPRTTIPVEQLAASRHAMDLLYPAGSVARQQVLEFGGELFARSQPEVEDNEWHFSPEADAALGIESHGGVHGLMEQARRRGVLLRRGTEDERLWCVWQRLTLGDSRTAGDLPRLTELVHEAYPVEADRQAALAWAETFHAHVVKSHRELVTDKSYRLGQHDVLTPLPAGEATSHWLLYQYIGLTRESRQAARQRWLRFFDEDKKGKVNEWGEALEKQRREAGEKLPPAGENVALLCVIERLTGSDALRRRCRGIIAKHRQDILAQFPEAGELINLSSTVSVAIAYPNDDLYHLVFGAQDPLRLCALGGFWWLSIVLVPLGVIGLRAWIFDLIGPYMLLLNENNKRFARYRKTQRQFEWLSFAVGYIVAPFVLWKMAPDSLPDPLAVLVPTDYHLLAGVFASVVLGGSVILFINRLVALVLIRLGWDIEETWLDEFLGVLIGSAILWYFENDWKSIVAFVVFAVVPEVLVRLKARRHKEANPEADETPEKSKAGLLGSCLSAIVVWTLVAAVAMGAWLAANAALQTLNHN